MGNDRVGLGMCTAFHDNVCSFCWYIEAWMNNKNSVIIGTINAVYCFFHVNLIRFQFLIALYYFDKQ